MGLFLFHPPSCGQEELKGRKWGLDFPFDALPHHLNRTPSEVTECKSWRMCPFLPPQLPCQPSEWAEKHPKTRFLPTAGLERLVSQLCPFFMPFEIVHTTEGTMVAHAWEGSSMLSWCGPRFPPPPPEREEKETRWHSLGLPLICYLLGWL